MQYVTLWSLKRYHENTSGNIHETLPLVEQHRVQQLDLERYELRERDSAMTTEELWRHQGRTCGYFKTPQGYRMITVSSIPQGESQ